MKELLSGNEALARGALEAGIEIACGYPGTPSSEILENVAKYKEIYSEWSVNEKVAMDAAAGAAYSGRRSMVTTKQVGMNVLSDSLFYTAYTGAEAALVVITADDPGLFSSQNEQDNRHYAKLGKFPMLEPCDSQECKDFMGEAVAISERFDTPVIIRTTMRTSHSKSVVELGEPASYGKQVGPFPRNMEKYNCMCTWARERHYVLEQRLLDLEAFSNEWPGNAIHWGDREYGFIAGGILYEYVRQVFPGASILKIGMCYPLPKKLIREFAEGVKNVIVVEELDPFMEEQIRAMGIDARGLRVRLPQPQARPCGGCRQVHRLRQVHPERLPLGRTLRRRPSQNGKTQGPHRAGHLRRLRRLLPDLSRKGHLRPGKRIGARLCKQPVFSSPASADREPFWRATCSPRSGCGSATTRRSPTSSGWPCAAVPLSAISSGATRSVRP